MSRLCVLHRGCLALSRCDPVPSPISQWSSSNVVDWMATLNLAPYTEIFKAKDIKGTDLLTLDRDKLIVSIVLSCHLHSLFQYFSSTQPVVAVN
ncbi:hypothetical protein E2C01_019246 [Portunus trituberculatus]|uniref:SAM domain-containing protein n=1 Tax=Portunus trituberculatus TaxID=210409 RepID=A0A5B7DZN8_PORTR|nr:hypothetical protein [Portunus trituberculatus]